MPERIHIVIDPAEKELFRSAAAREGMSLSEWLREAAAEKASSVGRHRTLESREALEEFFRECDAQETGREPDWEAHLEVIERSIGAGTGRP